LSLPQHHTGLARSLATTTTSALASPGVARQAKAQRLQHPRHTLLESGLVCCARPSCAPRPVKPLLSHIEKRNAKAWPPIFAVCALAALRRLPKQRPPDANELGGWRSIDLEIGTASQLGSCVESLGRLTVLFAPESCIESKEPTQRTHQHHTQRTPDASRSLALSPYT
jgi:hypothetical protein